MEDLIDIVADVHILPSQCEDGEPSKRRWVEDICAGSPAHPDHDALRDAPVVEDGVFSLNEQGEVQLLDLVGSSKVMGISAVTDSIEHELNSTLISKEVWKRCLDQAEKMKRDRKCSSQEDNRWVLRTSDLNGNTIVKIFCLECYKETSRDNGKHDKINT